MSQDQISEITTLIQQARSNALKVVNTELINLFWQEGEYISRRIASASWGEKTVDELAEHIKRNHPELKGFNRRVLYRMKQFYDTYSKSSLAPSAGPLTQPDQDFEIVSSPMTQLGPSSLRDSILARVSWPHHLVLLSRTRTEEEREFYLRLCMQEKYSVKQQERQISSGVFERIMLENQNQPPVLKGMNQDIANVFKDSYVFEFLNLSETHSEGALQKALWPR
ncbi:hypothetical protein GCM10023188_27230 [Pontibacter saemangeumensis]|uniref:YhcG N-terminal domain-containing protein n=1 Tax=Pontibacter saemangeumensis TaxID=1084525 RepID=A0ABP8LS08_9BACT